MLSIKGGRRPSLKASHGATSDFSASCLPAMRFAKKLSSMALVSAGIMATTAVQAADTSTATSAASAFPERPVTLLIGFPPGGATDTLGRTLANEMSAKLGQTVIVENRPGGDSLIATMRLVRAKPDGHTIMLTTSPHVLNPLLHKEAPYDPVKDAAPVARLALMPLVLIANTNFPPNTMQEVVAYSKANADPIFYASPARASPHHLFLEKIASDTGIKLTHVPYKGGGPAMIDLLGGRVSMMFGSIVQTTPMIKEKRVKALAIGAPNRDPVLPDVPTLSESGVPGKALAQEWFAIIAPAGTPDDIVQKLSRSIQQSLDTDRVRQTLEKSGANPAYSTPEELCKQIVQETKDWAALIKGQKIEQM